MCEQVDVQENETAGSKFRGSLVNALVFVAIVTVMTFVIVLLFKYGVRSAFLPNSLPARVLVCNQGTRSQSSLAVQCVKLIYGYMGIATFMIFFIMTGGIAVDLLQTLNVHIDLLSLVFILYNFAMVGSTILFFTPAPLLLKQVRCFSLLCRGCTTA